MHLTKTNYTYLYDFKMHQQLDSIFII